MNERTSNGRFAAGNAGGPGRPKRATEAEYLAVLSDVVSVDRWRIICQGAARAAEAGDRHAREWLSKYLVGDAKSADVEAAGTPSPELLQAIAADPEYQEFARQRAMQRYGVPLSFERIETVE